MTDFFIRIIVRLVVYRILTEVMRRIFDGSMSNSITYLDLQTCPLIQRHDTTLRFQSWHTLFTLVLKICCTVQNYK